MPTQKKIDTVEELRQKFLRCTITVATNYTGLDVNAMTDLRKKMRESEVEYRVVKNNLTYLAADAAERPEIKGIVQGPTALAFGYEDPIRVARVSRACLKCCALAGGFGGSVKPKSLRWCDL